MLSSFRDPFVLAWLPRFVRVRVDPFLTQRAHRRSESVGPDIHDEDAAPKPPENLRLTKARTIGATSDESNLSCVVQENSPPRGVCQTSVRGVNRQFRRVQYSAVEYHLRDFGIGIDRLRRILSE
jgi:hypothetical protein